MQFVVEEPLVLGEVEVNPEGLEVLRLAGVYFLEVFEEGLVSFLDVLSDDVAVHEGLEPELGDFLLGEVVVLGFLLLLGEELPDFLEVGVGEGVLAHDDVVNLLDVGLVLGPELALAELLLVLELFVELPLLDEVAVDGDGLDLFLEGGQFLDLLLDLFLHLELSGSRGTSSSSSTMSSSSSESSIIYSFLPFETINNQDISI